MAQATKIEWTDHSFNPWWGCTKVGPGCEHCYAETFDKRVGGSHWGSGAPRRRTKDWSKPRKWNRLAAKTGERPWVFCASMADVFDNEVPATWRIDLWNLVRDTPMLKWQFVTKRIGNAARMLPADWHENFRHCGLIATIVNQDEADRDIGKLVKLKETHGVAWVGLSMEPLLGPVDLSHWLAVEKLPLSIGDHWTEKTGCVSSLDWVIVGGESGHNARAMDIAWAEDIRRQCAAAGVAFFMKQLGKQPVSAGEAYPISDDKGKLTGEWPAALRVREYPQVPAPAPRAT